MTLLSHGGAPSGNSGGGVGGHGVNGQSTLHISETGQWEEGTDQAGAGEVTGALRTSNVLLGSEQLNLLVRIHELGSIGMAARALGISYRKAWDMVMALNRLSTAPLVYRTGIGTMGGVTLLSEEGKKIVSRLNPETRGSGTDY
jgi:molybdate transport repressor ModE-like protein